MDQREAATPLVVQTSPPPPAYGAPAANQVTRIPTGTNLPNYQHLELAREVPIYQDHTDAYVYLALGLILTILFAFSGPGIIALLCTIPAFLLAKEAIIAGDLGRHDQKAAKLGSAYKCLCISCFVGGSLAFCFVCVMTILIIYNFYLAMN